MPTDCQIVSCVGHLAQLMCQSGWCIVLSEIVRGLILKLE